MEKNAANSELDGKSHLMSGDRRYILCAGIPVGYQSLDAEGRITYVNKEWCDIFGYPAESVIGRWFGDFIPPERHGDFRKRFAIFKREGTIRDIELVVLCRNGVAKIICCNGKIEYSGSGGVHHTHCFMKDITGSKRIEEALRRSEGCFRTLSESAPVGIFLTDAEGRSIYTNRRLREISGQSDAEIKGFGWSRTIHPEDRDAVFNRVMMSTREQKELSATVRIITPGGKLKWLNIHSAPLVVEGGRQFGRVGTIMDITERKLAENALRESERKYRSVIDHVKFGVSVINRRMEIVSVNKQMMQWFPGIDVSKRPICYETYNDPPKTGVCSYCPTAKAFGDGKIHEAVSQMKSKVGNRNYRIISNPLKDENRDVIAVIETVEDVTDKLRMEEELLKGERRKSISILAAGVAHDFGNILSSLVGNISLIREQVEKNPEVSDLFGEVGLAVERARRLTHQLETFSRGEAPLEEVSEIGRVVRESAEFTLHGSTFSCVYDLPENLWPVEVVVDQFEQVVSNLVLNAVQAMPGGGTIKISGRNVAIGEIEYKKLSAGSYVRIAVEDSGSGIAKQDIPRIFDPFFTTKAGGTGLGLAHCLAIMKNHGGSILVESHVGVGTRFYLYLPVSKKESSKN